MKALTHVKGNHVPQFLPGEGRRFKTALGRNPIRI